MATAEQPLAPIPQPGRYDHLTGDGSTYCPVAFFDLNGDQQYDPGEPSAVFDSGEAAASNAATIQLASGPAIRSGPTPGTQKKNAEPKRNSHRPLQKAPSLPRYFMRLPVL
jgi:hypothetical protein